MMSSEELQRNVHIFRIKDVKPRDEHYFLLISDIHFDSPDCDRAMLKRHMDQAMERGAGIIINGDWFDVMCTYNDRRRSKDSIRPEYSEGNYLDLVVNDSIKWLAPYASNIMIMGDGNHETAIRKYHETDLLDRLTQGLEMKTGSKVYKGGYAGWVKILGHPKNDKKTRLPFLIRYHHGFGGARRSKGTLRIDLDAAKWPDANLVIKGHDHQKWYFPSKVRQRITIAGTTYKDCQYHLALGSYKEGLDDKGGYEIEKDFDETKMGGWWLKLHYITGNRGAGKGNSNKWQVEITEAN